MCYIFISFIYKKKKNNSTWYCFFPFNLHANIGHVFKCILTPIPTYLICFQFWRNIWSPDRSRRRWTLGFLCNDVTQRWNKYKLQVHLPYAVWLINLHNLDLYQHLVEKYSVTCSQITRGINTYIMVQSWPLSPNIF